jgi:winged helix DNA-binding protein
VPRRVREPALRTTWRQVLTLRLARQHLLERAPCTALADVVGEMVGLHAQVMSSAELQAAVRIDGLRASDVRDALWERRTLVKVWAFRQTLHLLTAADLAEFVVAARSLERWHTPAWLRYFELSEDGVAEVIDAIGAVLSDEPKTRVEVVDAVVARVRRPHLREDMMTGWGTFLGPAAQRGRLVFGPSEGRSVAFVDPSDWLGRRVGPADDPEAADDALARLVARYLAVFPGSSREMIARWWGGGRLAAVTRALARSPVPLAEIDVEGTRGLVRTDDVAVLAAIEPGRHVRLLPGFDPFTNELPRRVAGVLGDDHHGEVHRTAGWVTPIVVVDGAVAGTWELERRSRGTGTVLVQPFGRWRGGVRKALTEEVDRLGRHLGQPLRVELAAAAARSGHREGPGQARSPSTT